MPELPEVELVARDLHSVVQPPVRISRITFSCPTVLFKGGASQNLCNQLLISRLEGAWIDRISRRGKYILFHGRDGFVLSCHLKMTGRFIPVDDWKFPSLPYERARISFMKEKRPSPHAIVVFSDVRRFGRFSFFESESSFSPDLGPEPFDEKFSPALFSALQRRRKAPIKSVLLEQKIVCGIGNIYADEALFAAKISPYATGEDLSLDDIERLRRVLVAMFMRSIEEGGSSLGEGLGNFITPYAQRGRFQESFSVYHKQGLLCPSCCTSSIERCVIRGRSSHFCPICQKTNPSVE